MKIAVICPDFKRSNINKLPWKYIYEISKYLNEKNQIFVVTDAYEDDISDLKVYHLKKLFTPLKGESEELLELLERKKPDKCIMLMGLTSFLRREFKIEIPVLGVFTSPIYSLKELINNIGVLDLFKYHKYTFIHILNAIIPNYFVKKYSDNFEKIIFLSNYTCQKLVDKGFPGKKSIKIPVGIDEQFLDDLSKKEIKEIKRRINPDEVPIIMYFTSALTLRGTDTLIRAFVYLRKDKKCKLIFLSRVDHPELKKEEKILKNRAKIYDVIDSVEIISDYLSPNELKKYLSAADVVCLPFKIVISDFPVSILEAMAVGKPVISTNVASIPEFLPNGITITANDPKSLKDSLLRLLNDNRLIKELGINNKVFMDQYPKWNQIAEKFEKIIQM